ncbi:MAG: HAMP domain-containing histidine kinase [Candidatus Schekmanbacteria bacterium]|nr:HAMP domain-containing histidine kinase [Candidatus Schekmanbacteria bacterium]
MTRRFIAVSWCFLLLPAVVIAIFAFRALQGEEQRIAEVARAATREHLRALAATVAAGVRRAQEEVSAELLLAASRGTPEVLMELQRRQPYVATAFLWTPDSGLVFPAYAHGWTAEERRFLARYEPLFAERQPWHMPIADSGEQGGGAAQGWIPWFADSRVHLLGWVRPAAGGVVCGAELALLAVMARVIGELPAQSPPGYTVALRDEAGRVFHQLGRAIVPAGAVPEVTVSLAPTLPQWEVVAFAGDVPLGHAAARSFRLAGGLLVVTFLAAVVLGGALLTWQARQSWLDAERKTTFVSNVSHELKTPLTNIRMYAELLSAGRAADAVKRDQYLKIIVSESERLTRLVHNVLDFSRLERGSRSCRSEPHDLVQVLRGVLVGLGEQLAARGVLVEERLPATCARVNVDRDALERILLNVIDNAMKYGGRGGKMEVSIEVSGAGRLVTLRVRDYGPGVPDGLRERIFEKFFRVDGSLTAEQPGSGLGLYIARRLAREMGGELCLEAPGDGMGACFSLRLEVAEGGGA